MSGGIDSAVVYLLCKRAVPTIGIHLPSQQSSADATARAKELMGADYRSVNIGGIVSAAATAYDWNGDADRVRRGNLAARVRMMTLYDLAAEHNGLVVGTSNRTETMLGYGARWGDTVCDINPIGSLLKREVRELAVELAVPQAIIDAAPSADLWDGQTDEGELGFTYPEADAWLSPGDIDLHNIEPALGTLRKTGIITDDEWAAAIKIAARVKATEFKREPIPVWSA